MEDDFEGLFEQYSEENQTDYMRTNEFTDVQSSLRMVVNTLHLVPSDPSYWKWVILAAHSAVQGACVCLLTRTDGGGALSKQNEREWIDFHQLGTQKAITENSGANWILGDRKTPDTFIAPLPVLLRRLPKEFRVEIPDKPNVVATGLRNQDFQRLHKIRNKFTHFESIHMSLEVAGLPRIIGEAISLIERIVVSKQFHRKNRFQDLEIDPIILKCRLLLAEIDKPDP